MPLARRVLGEGCEATLIMRLNYAKAFYTDPNATLDDLREAVTTLEELETTARRVLGGSYPTTVTIEASLQDARALAALRACKTPEVLQTADDLAAHFGGLLGDSKNSYTYSTATVIWHGVSKHVGSDASSARNV